MEKRVAELEDRLRANSSNSSTAPSSNPLWAPKLKPKKPTGNKPGGQKGHQGHHRQLLPVEQVDEVVDHLPQTCCHCRAPLDQQPPTLRSRHQVHELPTRAVVVTEHRSYARTCASCGKGTTEPIPPAVRKSASGPRLSAALCYLTAFVHGSRRAVEEVAGELLGCRLSLGTVSNREAEMSEALESGYDQVRKRVRDAPAKNVDETGWRRAGRWLWVAATRTEALFRIDRGRNWHALQNLLGERVQGTVCSDRHGLYDRLKVECRAVCWAHLKRDFQRWVDRGGGAEGPPPSPASARVCLRLGGEGLSITKAVCGLFRRFKEARITRRGLSRLLAPLRRRMGALLDWGIGRGASAADAAARKAARVSRFCRNLKDLGPALWTFARVEGIEPTNNHAERMLRPGVIWRKKCFGSHSEGGCRYAERMMTAVRTLRLNGRSVMQYLSDTLHAHRHGNPLPSLA